MGHRYQTKQAEMTNKNDSSMGKPTIIMPVTLALCEVDHTILHTQQYLAAGNPTKPGSIALGHHA